MAQHWSGLGVDGNARQAGDPGQEQSVVFDSHK
jgi:hypothetical protein